MATTQRKPPGNPPPRGTGYTGRPPSKKQRRTQAAVRSISVSRRPPWQSPTVVTSVSVGIVAIVLIIIVVINQAAGGNVTTSKPLSAAVASAIEHPSASVIQAVGSGRQPGQMVRLPGNTVLTDASGKPMIVYVGAEYCPFCAAERWTMVYWLSQFGTFKNLSEIKSSSTDVYPNTNTVTFYKSTYTSSTIDFRFAETEDVNSQPLMTPTKQAASLFVKYDTPPYTTEAQGFPFIDIGGLYVLYATSYSPSLLANLTWDQIAAKLKNPSDPVTQAIVGNANIMTAATCIATHDTPASVCSSSTIQAIEPSLKAMTPKK